MTALPVVLALLAGLTVAPAPDEWNVELSQPISVSQMSRMDGVTIAVYPVYTLRHPANAFTVSGDADVVDVRGREPGGGWTEWTEAPAVLDVPATAVQVRVLYHDTAPRTLTVHAASVAVPPRVRAGAGLGYEVFATREGLVGGHTASGHVIVERDHFAALPSRRGLSTKDSGDYTVKVCARNGRCEWAPVWDVGPWNTKDDYWNPADVRQMWTDLPQGRPQAQAAKQDGYNAGLDQFGRLVRNPAGIDLADGMFWDGLQLTTNSWVTVTFLWTATGPRGSVASPQDVRSAPDPGAPVTGLVAAHAQVRVECQAEGWYRIAPEMWIAAGYVAGVTGAPSC
jgi:hypothetical protein